MINAAELDDRIVKCEKILATDANSQIFAALADAYRKKGDLARAQEICQKGLQTHPNYALGRIVMAKIYADKQDFENAWDELKLAKERSGRTRAIDILESEILIKKGRSGDAGAILRKLHLSDPGDETIKSMMKTIGEDQPAVQTFRKADIEMPSTPPAPSQISAPSKVPKKRQLILSEAVNIIRVTPRVLGVVAVSDQGLAIDGHFEGNVSNEEMAALSRGICDVCSVGSERISLGQTREILIESQSSKLWLIRTPRFLLVILTRDDVSMGSLRLKVEELLNRVEYDDKSAEQEDLY